MILLLVFSCCFDFIGWLLFVVYGLGLCCLV